MSARANYKHSFKVDWSENRYEQSNLTGRRWYRGNQKEWKKKFKIKTVLFPEIDEKQLQWQLRMDRRQKQAERDAEFEVPNNNDSND